jgi:hypothetical protein
MSSLDLVENLLVPLIMFGVYILLAVAVGLSARKRGRRLAMDLAYVSIQSVIHGVNQDFLFSICKSPILRAGRDGTVSGTLSRAPGVAQGVFQSELRNRLRHPWFRTIRPASLDGIADILNFFPALRVVKPLPVRVGRGRRSGERKGYLTHFPPASG